MPKNGDKPDIDTKKNGGSSTARTLTSPSAKRPSGQGRVPKKQRSPTAFPHGTEIVKTESHDHPHNHYKIYKYSKEPRKKDDNEGTLYWRIIFPQDYHVDDQALRAHHGGYHFANEVLKPILPEGSPLHTKIHEIIKNAYDINVSNEKPNDTIEISTNVVCRKLVSIEIEDRGTGFVFTQDAKTTSDKYYRRQDLDLVATKKRAEAAIPEGFNKDQLLGGEGQGLGLIIGAVEGAAPKEAFGDQKSIKFQPAIDAQETIGSVLFKNREGGGATVKITFAEITTYLEKPEIPREIEEIEGGGFVLVDVDAESKNEKPDTEGVIKKLKKIPAPIKFSCGDIAAGLVFFREAKESKDTQHTFTIVTEEQKLKKEENVVTQLETNFAGKALDEKEPSIAALHRQAAHETGKLQSFTKALIEGFKQKEKITLVDGKLGFADDDAKEAFATYVENAENIKKLAILPQWVSQNELQVCTAAPSYQVSPEIDSVDGRIAKALVITQYRALAEIAVIRYRKTNKAVNLHLTMLGQGDSKNPTEIMKEAMEAVSDIITGSDIHVSLQATKGMMEINAGRALRKAVEPDYRTLAIGLATTAKTACQEAYGFVADKLPAYMAGAQHCINNDLLKEYIVLGISLLKEKDHKMVRDTKKFVSMSMQEKQDCLKILFEQEFSAKRYNIADLILHYAANLKIITQTRDGETTSYVTLAESPEAKAYYKTLITPQDEKKEEEESTAKNLNQENILNLFYLLEPIERRSDEQKREDKETVQNLLNFIEKDKLSIHNNDFGGFEIYGKILVLAKKFDLEISENLFAKLTSSEKLLDYKYKNLGIYYYLLNIADTPSAELITTPHKYFTRENFVNLTQEDYKKLTPEDFLQKPKVKLILSNFAALNLAMEQEQEEIIKISQSILSLIPDPSGSIEIEELPVSGSRINLQFLISKSVQDLRPVSGSRINLQSLISRSVIDLAALAEDGSDGIDQLVEFVKKHGETKNALLEIAGDKKKAVAFKSLYSELSEENKYKTSETFKTLLKKAVEGGCVANLALLLEAPPMRLMSGEEEIPDEIFAEVSEDYIDELLFTATARCCARVNNAPRQKDYKDTLTALINKQINLKQPQDESLFIKSIKRNLLGDYVTIDGSDDDRSKMIAKMQGLYIHTLNRDLIKAADDRKKADSGIKDLIAKGATGAPVVNPSDTSAAQPNCLHIAAQAGNLKALVEMFDSFPKEDLKKLMQKQVKIDGQDKSPINIMLEKGMIEKGKRSLKRNISYESVHTQLKARLADFNQKLNHYFQGIQLLEGEIDNLGREINASEEKESKELAQKQTALAEATEQAQKIIKQGADVNAVGEISSPLICQYMSYPKILEILVSAGADINVNRDGQSFLEGLITQSKAESIEVLLKCITSNKQILKWLDDNGNNILHRLAAGGDLKSIKVLEEHLTSEEFTKLPEAINNNNNTPLECAILHQQYRDGDLSNQKNGRELQLRTNCPVEVARYFLQISPLTEEAYGKLFGELVTKAAMPDMILFMLNKVSDEVLKDNMAAIVNITDEHGDNILHYAAILGNNDALQLIYNKFPQEHLDTLLKAKNEPARGSRTPLEYGEFWLKALLKYQKDGEKDKLIHGDESYNQQIITALRDKILPWMRGPIITILSAEEEKEAELAKAQKSDKLCELLFDQGKDLKNFSAIEALLNAGADVNHTSSSSGAKPLYFAKDNLPLIKFLIDQGAGISDTGEVTNTGDKISFLQMAVREGSLNRVKIFLENETDLDFTIEGQSPLEYTAERGSIGVIKALFEKCPEKAKKLALQANSEHKTPLELAILHEPYNNNDLTDRKSARNREEGFNEYHKEVIEFLLQKEQEWGLNTDDRKAKYEELFVRALKIKVNNDGKVAGNPDVVWAMVDYVSDKVIEGNADAIEGLVDRQGDNLLHIAAIEGDHAFLEKIFEILPNATIYKMLQAENSLHDTPFNYAIQKSAELKDEGQSKKLKKTSALLMEKMMALGVIPPETKQTGSALTGSTPHVDTAPAEQTAQQGTADVKKTEQEESKNSADDKKAPQEKQPIKPEEENNSPPSQPTLSTTTQPLKPTEEEEEKSTETQEITQEQEEKSTETQGKTQDEEPADDNKTRQAEPVQNAKTPITQPTTLSSTLKDKQKTQTKQAERETKEDKKTLKARQPIKRTQKKAEETSPFAQAANPTRQPPIRCTPPNIEPVTLKPLTELKPVTPLETPKNVKPPKTEDAPYKKIDEFLEPDKPKATPANNDLSVVGIIFGLASIMAGVVLAIAVNAILAAIIIPLAALTIGFSAATMNKKKTPEVQANPTQRSTENMQQPAMKTHTHHAESLTTRNQGHKIG